MLSAFHWLIFRLLTNYIAINSVIALGSMKNQTLSTKINKYYIYKNKLRDEYFGFGLILKNKINRIKTFYFLKLLIKLSIQTDMFVPSVLNSSFIPLNLDIFFLYI